MFDYFVEIHYICYKIFVSFFVGEFALTLTSNSKLPFYSSIQVVFISMVVKRTLVEFDKKHHLLIFSVEI